MRKASQELFTHTRDKPASGWDAAIVEAERQVREAQARIDKLRLSIQSFVEFKERGEPFPGAPPEQQEAQP